MFIDTHCHISSNDYDDIDLIIRENEKAGIKKIIVSGCSYDSIIESISLSEKYDNVFLTIGFHPEESSKTDDNDILFLKDKLVSCKKVVGVGEIGLDYHYGKENVELQKGLFRKQLAIAEKLNLPVVIHSRDATEDTINILKEYKVKGVIHCFSGSIETANIYINMGFLIGIGGVVTFKNSNLFKVVENIGIKNIVLETDSPYLTPSPYRGEKNSSKYIPLIAEKISSITGKSTEEVALITTSNAISMFDLK